MVAMASIPVAPTRLLRQLDMDPGVFEQGDRNEACRSAVSGTPARPALVGPCGTAHPIPHAREKSRTAL